MTVSLPRRTTLLPLLLLLLPCRAFVPSPPVTSVPLRRPLRPSLHPPLRPLRVSATLRAPPHAPFPSLAAAPPRVRRVVRALASGIRFFVLAILGIVREAVLVSPTGPAASASPERPVPPTPVPCEQVRMPLKWLLPKAWYEDAFPWLASLVPPLLLSIALRSPVPSLISLALETAFLGLCFRRVYGDGFDRFNRPTAPPPMIERDWKYFYESLWRSHPTQRERSDMFMGWFYDRPKESLRREDAETMLAYFRFGTIIDILRPLQKWQLEFDVRKLELEINAGEPLPRRAHNESPLPCMRFSLEPLRFRHKPLAFYAITHGFHSRFYRALAAGSGFRWHAPADAASLGHFFRPALPNAPAGVDPLVFVHGVGGAAPYQSLLEELAAAHPGPIVVLDLPFVSLRICKEVPSARDLVRSVEDILDRSCGRAARATFVGHSFGSLILSWMVQSRPHRIRSCVFLDPICFMLHEKDILFNFHYSRVDQERQQGKPWNNPLGPAAIMNLAGSEMHTNHAMLRHFWWSLNELWPQDLTRRGVRAKVVLSECDDIVPADKVRRLFETYGEDGDEVSHGRRRGRGEAEWDGVEVEVLAGAKHGACAVDERHRKQTVEWILDMMREGEDKKEEEETLALSNMLVQEKTTVIL